MYYIYKEIYLDTLEKKYKTIIVMDNFPDILKPYVKRIKLNKLSEYKNNYNQVNCLYALKSFLDEYINCPLGSRTQAKTLKTAAKRDPRT